MSALLDQSYPKTMTHPNARKSDVKIYRNAAGGIDHADGGPDLFPPVIINNTDEEAYYRSRGYRSEGETMSDTEFQRFPMWMTKERKNGEGHSETEELLVQNAKEETEAKTKGFKSPRSDPEAYQIAIEAPQPADYVPEQYPKYLGQDAAGNDIIVNSEQEEAEQRKVMAASKAVWVETPNSERTDRAVQETMKKAERVAKSKPPTPEQKQRSAAQSERMKAWWANVKKGMQEAVGPSDDLTHG